MYKYKAFGLQIASEIALNGLLPGNGRTDITIRLGKVPDQLSGPITGKGARYQLNDRYFLQNIQGVAKYLVKDGQEIIIDKYDEAGEEDLTLFTINTPIGVLLHQRAYLPLHASAVQIGDSCAVFTGASGSGKSTTLAALNHKGYRMLTEEICAIQLSDDGIPFVHPGPAYTYLWRDVLDYFGKDTAELSFRSNNPEKYKVFLDKDYCNKSLPLKTIYILKTKNSPGFEIKELKGQDKFLPIKSNSYRHRLGTSINDPKFSFDLYATIGKNVSVKEISRPKDKLYIEELSELIINDLLNQ